MLSSGFLDNFSFPPHPQSFTRIHTLFQHNNQTQYTPFNQPLRKPFFSKPPTFTMKAVFVTLLSLAASAFASPVASRDVVTTQTENVEKTLTITTLTSQVMTYTGQISMTPIFRLLDTL